MAAVLLPGMSGDAERWAPTAREEVAEGMGLAKCQACGCMHDGLARLESVLAATEVAGDLLADVRAWQDDLAPVAVDCRGCAHCHPTEAVNAATGAVDDPGLLAIDDEREAGAASQPPNGGVGAPADRDDGAASDGVGAVPADWPAVPGDYHAMCTGTACPVAVSTLGDAALADELAAQAPEELCIVGPTLTENTGVEKVLENLVANPTIRVLVLAGTDPDGHHSGATLRALHEDGVTEEMAVAGSPGYRPVLANASRATVAAFRERVELVDLVGCADVDRIIEAVAATAETACTCEDCLPAAPDDADLAGDDDAVVEAAPSDPVRMDPAGYFVVVPRPDAGVVRCEQYDYDHERGVVVEGETASDVYRAVLERDLVSRLDHAAYLGAELARAELAVAEGRPYDQDGVPE